MTDPDVKKWIESAGRDMLPKMEESALSVIIFSGKIDAKLCVELGAAILFDKPIVVLVTEDVEIPRNLKRVALEIVHGAGQDEGTRRKLTAALQRVMQKFQ